MKIPNLPPQVEVMKTGIQRTQPFHKPLPQGDMNQPMRF